MHFYLRVMKRHEPDTYSALEQEALRKLLEDAPGVLAVKALERHQRGGYAVTLDVEPGTAERLSEYVSSNDLMLVI